MHKALVRSLHRLVLTTLLGGMAGFCQLPSALALSSQYLSENSDRVWIQQFGTAPKMLNESTLLKLVDPHSNCRSAVAVHLLMENYKSQLSSQTANAASVEQASLNLKNYARNLSQAPPSSCRDTALAMYAVDAVALLTQLTPARPPKDQEETAKLQLTPNQSMAFFVAAAFRKGLFEFSSGSSTQVSGKQILGTYVCQQGKISVDPVQEPLNLAATITHELSHLFIDKLSLLNALEYETPNSPPTNTHERILIEESYAALYSAFLQREFATKQLGESLRKYRLSDLSFYSESGPLAHISEFVESTQDLKLSPFTAIGISMFFGSKDWNFDYGFTNWAAADITPGGAPMLQLTEKSAEDFKRFRSQLYNKLSQAYFSKPLSLTDLELFQPDRLASILTNGRSSNPVLQVAGFDSTFAPQNHFTASLRVIRGQARAEVEGKPVFLTTATGKQISLATTTRLLRLLEDPYFLQVSLLCHRFDKAIQVGELKQYLGTGLKATHPSEKGVRPSEKGVRPCVVIGDRI